MEVLGKTLVFFGTAIVLIGALLWLLAKSGFKGLPGDISYQTPHGSFYFPVVSCILLSILATLAMWLWQWISRR